MSGSVLDLVTQALRGGGTRQIAEQLGLDEGSTTSAIGGAVPVLIGGLADSSASSEGAAALADALDRDHDGSILDDIGGFLRQGSQATSAGEGILHHVLGGSRSQVENDLGEMSGLDSSQTSQLLQTLAPIVLGAVGKVQRQNGIDAGGLYAMLFKEWEILGRDAENGDVL